VRKVWTREARRGVPPQGVDSSGVVQAVPEAVRRRVLEADSAGANPEAQGASRWPDPLAPVVEGGDAVRRLRPVLPASGHALGSSAGHTEDERREHAALPRCHSLAGAGDREVRARVRNVPRNPYASASTGC